MKLPRFSILRLMGIVAFVAVGFAAFRNPTLWWASAIFSLTVGVLCAAVLFVLIQRGRVRASWAGFAVFGWAYLGMTFGPWPNGNGVTAPPFPTMALYESLRNSLIRDSMPNPSGRSFGLRDSEPRGESLPIYEPGPSNLQSGPLGLRPVTVLMDLIQLRRIVHSFGAIVFGLIGALLGRIFAAREDRPQPCP